MPPYESDDISYEGERPSNAYARKRRRIEFVPQSSDLPTKTPDSNSKVKLKSSQDLYLAIISDNTQIPVLNHDDAVDSKFEAISEPKKEGMTFCDICKLPKADAKDKPHEISLVHQSCMNHSHPPSALDRRRKGFNYLSMQGWDPDARTGLGVDGKGRLYPIQPRVKDNKHGVGTNEKRDKQAERKLKHEPSSPMLNAGAMRKLDAEQRKRSEKLQRLFNGNDEVNRYLGIEP